MAVSQLDQRGLCLHELKGHMLQRFSDPALAHRVPSIQRAGPSPPPYHYILIIFELTFLLQHTTSCCLLHEAFSDCPIVNDLFVSELL